MDDKFERVIADIGDMIVKKEKKKRESHKLVIINEEELIRQIEIRPILYDKSLRGYRKSTLRDQSWKEIAGILGSTIEECRKRWRSLRDAFARHHKHISDEPINSKKKKWLYYDQMYFLAPYLECSSTIDDSGEISHENIIMESEEQIESIEENCDYKQDDGQHTQHNDEQTIDLYDENQVMTRIFASPSNYQITEVSGKKSVPDRTEEYTAIATTDPDERFLLSCSPILKRLPNKKNALARLKIQQILYSIEFGDQC